MSNITTTIEQSKELVRLGLDPNTGDMNWFGNEKIGVPYELDLLPYKKRSVHHHCLPAWSLTALLEVMPKPDLYRETADLWVCVTLFKEGSIRGFGETAIDAACDNITKMFERGYLKKKGGEQ